MVVAEAWRMLSVVVSKEAPWAGVRERKVRLVVEHD